jgi:hydroxylamine dehydrogenase
MGARGIVWLLCCGTWMVAPSSLHAAPTKSPSAECATCHQGTQPGIVSQWHDSAHAKKGVGCYECHQAKAGEPDAFEHYGSTIAVVVTPKDCARCHAGESEQFWKSHHAKGGNILASLDNRLAEVVEGAREPFDPHGAGKDAAKVNGLAASITGCLQCHGSKVALVAKDGSRITADQLKPGKDGLPTAKDVLANIEKDDQGAPKLAAESWPNTGIGRINLDGSLGSCTACHSRHDFSARRARQPENCGKCHLGPDHPQKEIYEESKHGVAYRDLKDKMNLSAKTWVLGKDYAQAPTCATCHMSGNSANGGKITHDPGERISWTNRPPISQRMDTDAAHKVVTEADPAKRASLVTDTWQAKRERMEAVCTHCHTGNYVAGFYKQYDDLVVLYNEKYARPGTKLMKVLKEQGLITTPDFDEEIEWTWFLLWHHEGRRARHGASMMAPDYAHWHGMYEVADRFYNQLIPQARELIEKASKAGKRKQAQTVAAVLDEIMKSPENAWLQAAKNAKETKDAKAAVKDAKK